jgi:CDP-4-dehydro-6-deoxyglucose reductase
MSQLLTLSRAARLVGTTRGVLQKKIRDGGLETFEGMVTPEALLRAFPQARLEDNTVLERLNQLKESAFARRLRERILPDPEVLAARLAELGQELADTRAVRERYRALVAALDQRLAALEREPATGARARELRVWLLREMTGILEDRAERSLLAMDRVLSVMSAHVQILPSGHEYFAEGSDTLLEAALRAGLPVNYGCTNGNCGLCKARLVTGEVKKVRVHDYALTEAEKNAGYLLLCSNAAVSDVVIEALEAQTVTDLPRQHINARVKSLVPVTPELLLLSLQTPRTQRLRFFAGQSAWLSTPKGQTALLPIASCPCDDRNLEFHVRTGSNGEFSQAVSALRVSDTVGVDGPVGSFVLDDNLPRPLIFIAIDTGFAPIKSLIEHALALDTAESLHLYWLSTAAGGHYLANLCRAWADALDNFRYTPLTGGPEALAGVLADHPDLSRHDVFLAGPETLLADGANALRLAGLPTGQLHLHPLS